MSEIEEVREAAKGTNYEPPEGWSINADTILFRATEPHNPDPTDFIFNDDVWVEDGKVFATLASDAKKYDRLSASRRPK